MAKTEKKTVQQEEVSEVENQENLEENTTSTETDNQEEKQPQKEIKKVFTIKDLLDAGVHFGHRTMRWNPKMSPYIYGSRNNIHIIDLTQTAIMMKEACRILREVAKKRGKILFVCTKKQGAKMVRQLAKDNNQFFVTNKWLGGMLTNWKIISQSIRKMKMLENQINSDELLKKEKVVLNRTLDKMKNNLEGIAGMGGLPDLIFVIDSVKEALAIHEARTLGIPVMAIADTNSDPDVIDYIIPGNDDSIKAIQLYCDAINATLSDVKVVRTEKKDFVKKNNSQNKKVSNKDGFKGKKDTAKNTKKPTFKKTEKTEDKKEKKE